MPKPAEPEQSAPVSLGLEAPIRDLVEDMNEEELAITLGLGLVAREAAAVEYVLHGIYVHLVEAARAYSQLPVATGGALVKQCRTKLEASTLADSCKTPLGDELDDAEDGFRVRNRYLHGYWIYDDESYQWLTMKGAHGSEHPEITFIEAREVWELAQRFRGICARLLHWDTAHFGEPAEDEDGSEGLVSVKHIRP